MPAKELTYAVGKGQSTNSKVVDDLKMVMELLNAVGPHQGGPQPLLNLKSINFLNAIQAIHTFQMFHFGMATGRIEPKNFTISKLHELVYGSPSAYVTFKREYLRAVVDTFREEIVKVATQEAAGTNTEKVRVHGVKVVPYMKDEEKKKLVEEGQAYYSSKRQQYYYKRPKAEADRLREYWKVVPGDQAKYNPKPEEELKSDSVFFTGGPRAWCAIFATWVLNQAQRRTQFGHQLTFKTDHRGGIFRNDGKEKMPAIQTLPDNNLLNPVPLTKVNYRKGDVCIVKEENVQELFPTHHFIVAEDPAQALAQGRYMKTIEGNYAEYLDPGYGGSHSVTFHKRQVLNYIYYDVVWPPPL